MVGESFLVVRCLLLDIGVQHLPAVLLQQSLINQSRKQFLTKFEGYMMGIPGLKCLQWAYVVPKRTLHFVVRTQIFMQREKVWENHINLHPDLLAVEECLTIRTAT
jgi:hypothetical protein